MQYNGDRFVDLRIKMGGAFVDKIREVGRLLSMQEGGYI